MSHSRSDTLGVPEAIIIVCSLPGDPAGIYLGATLGGHGYAFCHPTYRVESTSGPDWFPTRQTGDLYEGFDRRESFDGQPTRRLHCPLSQVPAIRAWLETSFPGTAIITVLTYSSHQAPGCPPIDPEAIERLRPDFHHVASLNGDMAGVVTRLTRQLAGQAI